MAVGGSRYGFVRIYRSCLRQAKPLGDLTVASIFVYHVQLLPLENFDTYPRSCDSDFEKVLHPEPQTRKVHPDPMPVTRSVGVDQNGALRMGPPNADRPLTTAQCSDSHRQRKQAKIDGTTKKQCQSTSPDKTSTGLCQRFRTASTNTFGCRMKLRMDRTSTWTLIFSVASTISIECVAALSGVLRSTTSWAEQRR
ncbi:hypothetical protein D3H34_29875 [Acidovorax cavernicola]|uniref:Uncharacterized protein n=1 Tax=Acidovorax cavernicola TaxID=1675792 RepID=A0A9X8GSE6_9BURK|nr:hypothetical protein D3H34_29875 [Acidovorax cavernicola]